MAERTCIGCGSVFDKKKLVRLVVKEESVLPDLKGVMPGRGAYICPRESCLAGAYKRKGAFQRAFRRGVKPPQMEELRRGIMAAVRQSAR